MQCECAILSFVAYPGLPHYFINGAIFVGGGGGNEHKICVRFSPQLLSETFFILRRSERHMIKSLYWSSCKVHVVLVKF